MVLHHFGETAYKELDIAEAMNCNTPIMVENIDFGGHWRVIIG